MKLEYETRAGEPGGPLVLLMHGRGADARDLAPIAAHFPSGVRVILPHAPFPAAPWGYGPGRAWYRYLGGAVPEPESFSASMTALDELIAELVGNETASGRPFLGGFSQGGTLSLGYALSRPGAARGVLNFSGFLPDHPEVVPVSGSAEGLPVFWGHGRGDASIPFSLADEGRATLVSAGADLHLADYPIGHWIDGGELDDAIEWLERRLEA